MLKGKLKNSHFSCTGSEMLQIAPMLLRYLTKIRPREQERLHPYIDSMLACLEAVILLQSTRTRTATAPELEDAVNKHLNLFMESWGEDFVKPKHHYATHLPEMLAWFKWLIASFVHERKHRLINKYGRDRKNAARWDRGLIEDIICHQLWELQQPFYFASKEVKPMGLMCEIVIDLFPDVAQTQSRFSARCL